MTRREAWKRLVGVVAGGTAVSVSVPPDPPKVTLLPVFRDGEVLTAEQLNVLVACLSGVLKR